MRLCIQKNYRSVNWSFKLDLDYAVLHIFALIVGKGNKLILLGNVYCWFLKTHFLKYLIK